MGIILSVVADILVFPQPHGRKSIYMKDYPIIFGGWFSAIIFFGVVIYVLCFKVGTRKQTKFKYVSDGESGDSTDYSCAPSHKINKRTVRRRKHNSVQTSSLERPKPKYVVPSFTDLREIDDLRRRSSLMLDSSDTDTDSHCSEFHERDSIFYARDVISPSRTRSGREYGRGRNRRRTDDLFDYT